MNILKTFFFALFFPLTLAAQKNEKTLQQCIDLALANNINVKQQKLAADAASVNLTQAKNNLLPGVNGSYEYGLNQGRTVNPLTNSYINQQLTYSAPGLNANLVLFNGMRLQNLIQQNRFDFEAGKMDLQQSKDNLTLNVILGYLQVLSNMDVLDISRAQVTVSSKQIDRMQILVNEGAAAIYQLTDLKGQRAGEEITVVNSVNDLQQSILSLCRLMNIDYNSELQLKKSDAIFPQEKYTDSASAIYETALQHFASIQAGLFRIKSYEKAIKVSRGGLYPTISLNANVNSSTSSLAQTLSPSNITQVPTGDYVVVGGNQSPVITQQQNYSYSKTGYVKQLNNNLGTFVGLSLQVPIFNRFQVRSNIKLAKINLQNAQLASEDEKAVLKQNIDQAYLNMNAAFDKYTILQTQVNDFDESFRVAEIRFMDGVINSPEYLIAKNNLETARISMITSKYDYSFRVAVLDYYKGKK